MYRGADGHFFCLSPTGQSIRVVEGSSEEMPRGSVLGTVQGRVYR